MLVEARDPGNRDDVAETRRDALVDSPIAGDTERWIDGPDGHHLQRVRRLEVDEAVVVADGAGCWYPAAGRVDASGLRTARATGELHVEPVRRPG